jgi:hypothetical protein
MKNEKKKLTRKQEVVVAASLDPKNKTVLDVARATGVSDRQIRRMSENVLFQEALQTEKDKIIAEAEKMGLGTKQAARMIVKGCQSKTTGQFGGDPDMKTRHIYLETFLKLKGVLSDGKEPVKPAGNSITFNFNDMRTEDLIRSVDEIISERLRRKRIEAQGTIPSV